MIDFNLARFKYINCVGEGRPISHLETRAILLFDGSKCFESLSQLSGSLKLEQGERSIVYGPASGCGTDAVAANSIFKCISESLERWAYFDSYEKKSDSLRFDINPTSTGFAAFPGMFNQKVRALAKFEALERWTLVNWWNGRIRLRRRNSVTFPEGVLSVYQLSEEARDYSVCLLHFSYSEADQKSFHAYGFAAGPSFNHAFSKSKIELDRNIKSLKRFFQQKNTDLVELRLIEDARLLFFSNSEGFRCFSERVASSQEVNSELERQKVVVDTEIVGPWSKYTSVWRYLLEDSHCPEDDHQFFFF